MKECVCVCVCVHIHASVIGSHSPPDSLTHTHTPFDPYNALLAIATNIPVLLLLCSRDINAINKSSNTIKYELSILYVYTFVCFYKEIA